MAPETLYEIPMATPDVRLFMGCACLLFVVGIFGWWLPRGFKYLRDPSTSKNAVVIVVFLLPVAIGFAPLTILIALIRNPTTFITQTGVMKQSVFQRKPVSLLWSDIDHVSCDSTRGGPRLRSIIFVGSDGERIEIGNASGVDLYSIRDLVQNQLGAKALRHCGQLRPPQ